MEVKHYNAVHGFLLSAISVVFYVKIMKKNKKERERVKEKGKTIKYVINAQSCQNKSRYCYLYSIGRIQ